jgi:putative FmdB family regulatory protein
VPTYSYRCTECDTAFDIQQSFSDDSLTVCPTCAGKLRKVFSAVGVSFTGSGFYQNDSRPAAPAAPATPAASPAPAAPAPAAATTAATTP